MIEPVLVHDGRDILPSDRASVPVLDHGFLYGDSVYEVVRSSRGRPFLLEGHLARLRRSAALIYFDLPWSDEEIRLRIAALQEAVGSPDAYFRIVATRGPGPISLLPDGCTAPRLYVIACPLSLPEERLYREGCSLAVVPRLRNDPRALDPKAKTGNYLNNMLGLIEARRRGADDALFLNSDDHVTESSTSNVWVVEEGRALTPPLAEGLLAGITRDWIFRTLPPVGVPVAEESLPRERLARVSEIFLSGTIKGVLPVTRLDGSPVGTGEPGPVTRRAAALYEQALDAPCS